MTIDLTKEEVIDAIKKYVSDDLFFGNYDKDDFTVSNDYDINGCISLVLKDKK